MTLILVSDFYPQKFKFLYVLEEYYCLGKS